MSRNHFLPTSLALQGQGQGQKTSPRKNNEYYLYWRVAQADTWILQTHQIGTGRLKPTNNALGIHTRNEKGEQARVRDNFAVARLFLVYHAS